ncbi:hypothetical protein L8106_10947 [Lyngbya sp. PCC 8106]|nr:hypothetical protein L8106_10947 [Lyngbya sp. PCC 8106]
MDEIIKILEKDVNLNRIKKVMICACRGKWENNQQSLNNFDIKDLVQELYWKTQTPDNLANILERILSKINKKSEYTLIVHRILELMGELYVENQLQPPKLNGSEPLIYNSPPSSASSGSERTAPYSELNSLSTIPNLFEIRWRIMQYTNPLRVKILLFSTLEREFDFNTQDWSQLKLHSLDDLLRQLIRNFSSLAGLENHLIKMANYLENPDENIKTVELVIEALVPIYTKTPEKTTQKLPENFNQEKDSIDHKITSKRLKNSNLIPTDQANSQLNSPLNLSSDNTNLDSFISEKLSLTQSNLISTNLKTEELVNLNNQLESQITRIVNKSIKKTIYPINQTWDELQNLLDLCFKNLPPAERNDLKKHALQELLNVISLKVNELQESLDKLETPEQQSWQTLDLSQQKMMGLARQGNAKAIATLINQSLKHRGINTQVKSQNRCLHVVLTAEPIPDSETTASFIHKKLIFLKIQSIQTIKIYGRKTGTKSIAWTQEYTYNQLKT